MRKNVASQVVGAQMNSKTDGSAVTTGTTTVYVTGDGGTQAAGSVGSGACTHEGQGFWTYAPAQAETNYDHVAFTFVNTNAVAATVQVYPSYPQTGDNYARLGAPAGASVSVDIAAIKTQTAAIEVDTADIQSRLPAALVGGRMDSDVGNVTAAGDVADAVWNAATATYGAAGSYGLLVETNLDAVVSTLATQASVNTIDDFLDTEIAAIKAKTDSLTFTVAGQVDANAIAISGDTVAADNLEAATDGTGYNVGNGSIVAASVTGAVGSVTGAVGSVTGAVGSVTGNVGGNVTGSVGSVAAGGIAAASFAAGAVDAAALAADAAAEIADKLLGRNLDGGADGTRTVSQALYALRNKSTIAAGTLTVYKVDDTTSSWTASVTTAAGDPLSGIDPA